KTAYYDDGTKRSVCPETDSRRDDLDSRHDR
ncbi:hypothetical protein A5885_000070, partial [Enterococcus sp. 8E11_MSG4843]